MKKIASTLVVLISLLAFLTGCSNDQYSIEKQYWGAQKQAEKIFKNPSASPPNELQRIVNLLAKFSEKYPKNILSAEADFSIARLYIVKEEFNNARTQLNSIINKYKKSETICSEAVFLIGNSYEIENRWNQALEQYKKIMLQYPITKRGIDIPVYIAQHYKIKYQPDLMITAFHEAIIHYKTLSNKYPQTPLAFNADVLAAKCYEAVKEWDNTISAFKYILETYKGKVNLDQVLLNMAVIYDQQLKDKIRAKEYLEKLISDYPKGRFVKIAKELLKKVEAEK